MNYGVMLHDLINSKRVGIPEGTVILAWSVMDRCFVAFDDDAEPVAKAAGEVWVHSPWHPPKVRVPIVRVDRRKLQATVLKLRESGRFVALLDHEQRRDPDPGVAGALAAAAVLGGLHVR